MVAVCLLMVLVVECCGCCLLWRVVDIDWLVGWLFAVVVYCWLVGWLVSCRC